MRQYLVIYILIILFSNTIIFGLSYTASCKDFQNDPILFNEALTNTQFRSEINDDTIERITPLPRGNSLWDIAWKPNGNYGLMVGDEGTVMKYDGNSFEDLTPKLDNIVTLASIAWKPNGGYALICGYSGSTLFLWKYDGDLFTTLTIPQKSVQLRAISWKPDSSYALIVGSHGTVYKYSELSGVSDISPTLTPEPHLIDVDWKPDGSYAIIVGGGYESGYYSTVLTYDGSSFTDISSQFSGNGYVYAVSWKPNNDYALIVMDNLVCKYNGIDFTYVANLRWAHKVCWKPDGSYALILYEDGLARCDGTSWVDLYAPDELKSSNTRGGIDWLSNGSYAVIVGPNDRISKYDGNSVKLLSNHLVLWYSHYGTEVEWRPDGKYALITSSTGTYKFDGNNFEKLTDIEGLDISWKPDGEYAILSCDNGKIVKCYEDNVEEITSGLTDRPLWTVAWKPDSSYALLGGGGTGGEPILFKYDGESFIDISDQLDSYEINQIFWEPKGTYAIIRTYNEIWKFEDDTFVNLNDKFGYNEYLSDIDWNSDSDHALVTGFYREDFSTYSNIIWRFDGEDFFQLYNETGEYEYNKVKWQPSSNEAFIFGLKDLGSYFYHETLCIKKYDGENFQTRSINIGRDIEDADWEPHGKYLLIVGEGGTVLKYIPSVQPPILLKEIPSTYYIYEDDHESGKDLIDLKEYFYDEDGFETIDFEVSYKENVNIVDCKISGEYLDFIQTTSNWYGTLDFQVKAIDYDNLERTSNIFTITVKPTNDPPIITDINGRIPINDIIELALIQNVQFNGQIHVEEYDDENIFYQTNLTIPDFNLDHRTGALSFMPENEDVGIFYGNITVTDENGTSDHVNISLTVKNVNDPPITPVITSPLNNSIWWTTDLIFFNGSSDDPDLYLPGSDEVLTYTWASDISGIIGTGKKLIDQHLETGTHKITLDVKDMYEAKASTSIVITVYLDPNVEKTFNPFVELESPLNNHIIKTNSINLTWTTNHSKPEVLLYNVYFGQNPDPVTIKSEKQSERFLVIKNLVQGQTYYWTVVPYFGTHKGICSSGVWSFRYDISFKEIYDFEINGPSIIPVKKGEQRTENIQIKNIGNIVDKYSISLGPTTLDGITVESQITINASDSKHVYIYLKIPENVVPDEYSTPIKVRSESGLEKNFSLIIKVEEEKTGSESKTAPEDKYLIWIIIAIVIIIIIVVLLFIWLKKKKEVSNTLTNIPTQTSPETVQPQAEQASTPPVQPFQIQTQSIQPQTYQQQPELQAISATVQNICPNCNTQMTYYQQTNNYYCYNCQKYI